MDINLTPIKNETELHIYADIYPMTAQGIYLTAKPAVFRVVQRLHEQDKSSDTERGALLTISIDKAMKFAKQILEITEEEK